MLLKLAMVGLLTVQSADERRARGLIEEVRKRHQNARSLTYTVAISDDRTGSGKPEKATGEVVMRARNRLRIDLRYTAFGKKAHDVIQVRGKELLEYRSTINQHVVSTLDKGAVEFSMPELAGHFYLGGSIDAFVPPPRGGAASAWKFEESREAVTITISVKGDARTRSDRAIYTLKVDPRTHTVLFWGYEARTGKQLRRKRDITYSNVRFDAEIPDETFAFALPKKSRKVEAFTDPFVMRLKEFVGKKLPDLDLVTHDEKKTKLSEAIRGSVALVCLWTTYHPDCTLSIHHFNILHRRFGDRGLKILLVSHESPEELKAFIDSPKQTQPRWGAAFYSASKGLAEPYTLARELPTSFLVDREGTIRHVFIGVAKESRRYTRPVGTVLEDR